MLPIADPRSERGRICAAYLYLIAEGGQVPTTLSAVLETARVDDEAFHSHFEHLDDCFLAIWHEFDGLLDERMRRGYETGSDWRESMRNGLGAALGFIASEPMAARLYIVESDFAVGGRLARRQTMIPRLAELIDRAPARPGAAKSPPMILEAIAGAIRHHISRQIRNGAARELPRELPQLMYFVVLPFLGTEVAIEELRRPPPAL